jgi:hypothetical protein
MVGVGRTAATFDCQPEVTSEKQDVTRMSVERS